MESQKPWQKKGNWIGLISAILVFIPGVDGWIAANPVLYGSLVNGVFMLVTTLSKGKVS